MTVIAAVAHEGRVTIAADTMSTGGSTSYASRPKIARYPGDVLLAAAGSATLLPALRDPATIPHRATDDLDEWAQSTAEKITAALLFREPPLVDEGSITGELLLAHAGRLWYIDANLASPVPDGVAVLGSGSDVAYGAVHAALDAGADPYRATTQAVALACRRNVGCGMVDGVPQVECA